MIYDPNLGPEDSAVSCRINDNASVAASEELAASAPIGPRNCLDTPVNLHDVSTCIPFPWGRMTVV